MGAANRPYPLSPIPYTLFPNNLQWLAESLGAKSGETPDETIRRYLSASFFTDHLQTYKRRPIYWCFSSGKQKAFEALVYLHRYHEGTLARMRMEYVVPLQGKMAPRIDRLADDIASASTTAQARRLQKERDKLTRHSTNCAATTSNCATTPTNASPWTWTMASRSTTPSSATCWRK